MKVEEKKLLTIIFQMRLCDTRLIFIITNTLSLIITVRLFFFRR